MPELPEVEITRQGIAPAITGQVLRRLVLGKPLRWPLGCAPQQLHGRTVAGVGRRGKYLMLHFTAGDLLLVHLGMSGSLRLMPHAADSPAALGLHEHALWVFDRHELRLHDPRRFGAVVYAPGEDAPQARKLLDGLGVEPLSDAFTPQTLVQGFRGRRQSIKQAVLAGDVVVGVGNIYVSEALFLAGIHPRREAGRVSAARLARLHTAIVQVMQEALAHGGSTLRDFVAVDGSHGHFQLLSRVYGRKGEPCPRCSGTIAHIVQGQRSSYFCPRCQG